MRKELLRAYVVEVVMSQNIVRRDTEGSGNLVIRKLVTYEKPASVFKPGDDVDTELTPAGDVVIDDLETWHPDFEKSIKKPRRITKRVHRVA